MTNIPDDVARDKNGQPLFDRFGRPVRRRPHNAVPQAPTPAATPQETKFLPANKAAAPQPAPQQAPQPVQQQFPQQRFPGQTPEPTPAPRSRWRLPRPELKRPSGCGCLSFLIVLVLLSIIAFAGAVLWTDTKVARVAAGTNGFGATWLLVGSDSRQGLSEADVERLGTGGDIGTGRTDTIMLVHVPLSGKATVVSLPRDSYVEIPGYGMDKLNAAFAYGGAPLLVETVQKATGVPIAHYAEIGFGGFAGIVDALGGVNMCLADALYDPLANINVEAGCQNLDGATALGYARSRRFANGDLERVQHQRELVTAIVKKVTSTSTLINPFRLVKLLNAGAASVTLGKADHVWNLAFLAFALAKQPTMATVPVADFKTTDVGSVVEWDEVGASALFAPMR